MDDDVNPVRVAARVGDGPEREVAVLAQEYSKDTVPFFRWLSTVAALGVSAAERAAGRQAVAFTVTDPNGDTTTHDLARMRAAVDQALGAFGGPPAPADVTTPGFKLRGSERTVH